VNATAIGSGDSLVTETSVIPPPSATDQTRCTASPDGMRNRVSTTGVPAVRTWRTAATKGSSFATLFATAEGARDGVGAAETFAHEWFTDVEHADIDDVDVDVDGLGDGAWGVHGGRSGTQEFVDLGWRRGNAVLEVYVSCLPCPAPVEDAAREWFRSAAGALGLEIVQDPASNLWAVEPGGSDGPFDAVLFPAYAVPAVRHGAAMNLPVPGIYMVLANVLGFPAGVVPVMFSNTWASGLAYLTPWA